MYDLNFTIFSVTKSKFTLNYFIRFAFYNKVYNLLCCFFEEIVIKFGMIFSTNLFDLLIKRIQIIIRIMDQSAKQGDIHSQFTTPIICTFQYCQISRVISVVCQQEEIHQHNQQDQNHLMSLKTICGEIIKMITQYCRDFELYDEIAFRLKSSQIQFKTYNEGSYEQNAYMWSKYQQIKLNLNEKSSKYICVKCFNQEIHDHKQYMLQYGINFLETITYHQQFVNLIYPWLNQEKPKYSEKKINIITKILNSNYCVDNSILNELVLILNRAQDISQFQDNLRMFVEVELQKLNDQIEENRQQEFKNRKFIKKQIDPNPQFQISDEIQTGRNSEDLLKQVSPIDEQIQIKIRNNKHQKVDSRKSCSSQEMQSRSRSDKKDKKNQNLKEYYDFSSKDNLDEFDFNIHKGNKSTSKLEMLIVVDGVDIDKVQENFARRFHFLMTEILIFRYAQKMLFIYIRLSSMKQIKASWINKRIGKNYIHPKQVKFAKIYSIVQHCTILLNRQQTFGLAQEQYKLKDTISDLNSYVITGKNFYFNYIINIKDENSAGQVYSCIQKIEFFAMQKEIEKQQKVEQQESLKQKNGNKQEIKASYFAISYEDRLIIYVEFNAPVQMIFYEAMNVYNTLHTIDTIEGPSWNIYKAYNMIVQESHNEHIWYSKALNNPESCLIQPDFHYDRIHQLKGYKQLWNNPKKKR